MTRSLLIVGAGYVGRALGGRLRNESWSVTGWVRSKESAGELAAAGWKTLSGDVADPDRWKEAGRFDAIVYCPSTRGGAVEDYRHLHLEGLGNAIAAAPEQLVYTSATSVYAQDDGSLVTEESPAEPIVETSRVLLDAEHMVTDAGGTALRVSAIYGPDRGVLYRRLLAGEAFIPEGADRWINMIHRDDVAGAIAHSLASPSARGQVYNATDDEPVTYREFYEWLCARLNLPLPPLQSVEGQMKKRGLTRKRVSNAKLRAAGWQPLYPDFRAGYSAVIEDGK